MAPEVLRCTPHEDHLLDRTGIITASAEIPRRDTGTGVHDAVDADLPQGVHRSGVASLAAWVLMLIVTLGAVVNPVRHGHVPADIAGEAVRQVPAEPAPRPPSPAPVAPTVTGTPAAAPPVRRSAPSPRADDPRPVSAARTATAPPAPAPRSPLPPALTGALRRDIPRGIPREGARGMPRDPHLADLLVPVLDLPTGGRDGAHVVRCALREVLAHPACGPHAG